MAFIFIIVFKIISLIIVILLFPTVIDKLFFMYSKFESIRYNVLSSLNKRLVYILKKLGVLQFFPPVFKHFLIMEQWHHKDPKKHNTNTKITLIIYG